MDQQPKNQKKPNQAQKSSQPLITPQDIRVAKFLGISRAERLAKHNPDLLETIMDEMLADNDW